MPALLNAAQWERLNEPAEFVIHVTYLDDEGQEAVHTLTALLRTTAARLANEAAAWEHARRVECDRLRINSHGVFH